MSARFPRRLGWMAVSVSMLVCLVGPAGAAETKAALPLCPSAAHKAYACAYAYCYGDKKKCSMISKVTPHCPICEQDDETISACNHAIRKAINSKPMEPKYFACR